VATATAPSASPAPASGQSQPQAQSQPAQPTAAPHPLDEIMAMLKTGYPLLALSMETMVDQIQLKFKPQADEDMYRLVAALYHEGAQVIHAHKLKPRHMIRVLTFYFCFSNYYQD
jgi:transformation/transcription domain-associated protein